MNRRQLIAGAAAAALPAWTGSVRAQGRDADILLGHTGILGGPLGTAVRTFLAGAMLAFDQANAGGGVQGRRVKLVSLDDELKPDLAVANYRKLLDEQRVVACFGCVGSGTTAAAAPVLADSGAPLVGPYAVADSARDRARGAIYCTRASYGREAEVLVQHLSTLGISRIAVAVLANPGGKEVAGLVEAALGRHRQELAAAVNVEGDGRNIGEAARALAQARPQATLMYLGGTLPAEFMKAVWAAGASPSFYGMSIVQGEVAARALGDLNRGLAIAQITPYPWGQVEPMTRDYRRLAESRQVPVGYTSFEGFLSAQAMLEALRRAGRDVSRASLHTALQGMRLRLAGMDIDFTGGQHNGSRFVELVQVARDGRYVR